LLSDFGCRGLCVTLLALIVIFRYVSSTLA
jgi:hypothetical protein